MEFLFFTRNVVFAGGGVVKRTVSETFGRRRSLRWFIKRDQTRNES